MNTTTNRTDQSPQGHTAPDRRSAGRLRRRAASLLAGATLAFSLGACAVPASALERNVIPFRSVVKAPALDGDARPLVHGRHLHIRCVGQGKPTVVLIPGFGDALTAWSDIEKAIAPTTRVCSYERFGNGTSDSPPGPQTFAIQARDLHRLLRMVHVPGPYVLVGHSLGGTEAVTFASLFRSEVSGLLLIDATPANWGDAVCGIKDDGTAATRQWHDFCLTMRNPAKNQEHLASAIAYRQAAKIQSLGRLPLIVDAAVNDDHAQSGLGARDVARLKRASSLGQRHWASLSKNASLNWVRSSHYIHIDRPQLIVRQIGQLVGGPKSP